MSMISAMHLNADNDNSKHGIIHDCLRLLIIRKFGNEAFDKIVSLAGCDDVKDFRIFEIYDDAVTMRLVGAVCEVLNLDLNTVLETFGEFFYHYTVERGFSEMLASLGRDLVSFLNGLDAQHYFLNTFIYGGIRSPSFRCEVMEDGSYLLHYYSTRDGLHPVAIGVIRACAKEICKTNAKITTLEVKKEHFGTSSHSHVQFRIDELDDDGFPIPRSSLLIPGTASLNSQMPKSNNSANMDGLGGLLLNAQDFASLLPFHVLFDKHMIIRGMGLYLSRLFRHVHTGARVTDCFKLVYPKMHFEWEAILNFVNLQYIVEVTMPEDLATLQRSLGCSVAAGLHLRGQMFPLSDRQHILYVASVRLTNLKQLRQQELFLSDMPSHDATRELILLNQLRSAELDLSKKLEETTTELQVVSRALEKEKAKTEALLDEILPKSVADALKEGKVVPACSFEEVTILFSDIVNFTVMSSNSEPNQVVNMLNDLFTLFDELSRLNDVYKVETIGDAYMVCGGVPDPIPDHAERVSNMALGMNLVASMVNSSNDQKPIQIRIGIHSGPVMSGVVGKRMPRYCLFGDTVNTASRMESHGVPGKIQISPTTHACLDKSKYLIDIRGVINVKGKGEMTTYFLRKHLQKTFEELIGRPITIVDVEETGRTNIPGALASPPMTGQFLNDKLPATKVVDDDRRPSALHSIPKEVQDQCCTKICDIM